MALLLLIVQSSDGQRGLYAMQSCVLRLKCGIAGSPLSSYPVVFPAKILFGFSALCAHLFLLRAFTLSLLNHQGPVFPPKNRKVSQSHSLSPRSLSGSFFSLSVCLSLCVK